VIPAALLARTGAVLIAVVESLVPAGLQPWEHAPHGRRVAGQRIREHPPRRLLLASEHAPQEALGRVVISALHRSLSRNMGSAAIISSEAPVRLLPAALVSIQKGQPANCAARRQTSARRLADSRPLLAGAAPRARLASKMGGQ
jgi:hypothetical protein